MGLDASDLKIQSVKLYEKNILFGWQTNEIPYITYLGFLKTKLKGIWYLFCYFLNKITFWKLIKHPNSVILL